MVLSVNVDAQCKNCGVELKKRGIKQNVEWCGKDCKKAYKSKLKKAKKLMRKKSSEAKAEPEYEELTEIVECGELTEIITDEIVEDVLDDNSGASVSSCSYEEPKPWDSDNKTVTQHAQRIHGVGPGPRRISQTKKP